MNIYFRCKNIFAVYFEISTILGKKPLFSLYKYHKEYIVDMPFTTLILSPSSVLKRDIVTYEQQKKRTGEKSYST